MVYIFKVGVSRGVGRLGEAGNKIIKAITFCPTYVGRQ